jgi:D-glycero-D-manno-heptose 1,7-bisphosphate phosphatase
MMSLRRALFLDRDGTITRDNGYTYRVEHLAWLPGARETIAAANRVGAVVVVVTNQSGIGRGYFTEADMHAFHFAMQRELAAVAARIDAFYFCPFIEAAADERYRAVDHPDRKPNPGMLLRAMADHRIEPSASLMIGDLPSDIEAGRRAGVPSFQTNGSNLFDLAAPWLDSKV